MRDIEYILEFAVDLGREMIANGATLERVNTVMEQIPAAYGLHDISMFNLSTMLQLSAKDEEDIFAIRQISVPGNGIHLERLHGLNNLVYRVCKEKPEPKNLAGLLIEAYEVKEYPLSVVAAGQVLAACSLSMIFGATIKDMVATGVVMALIFVLMQIGGASGINKFIQTTIYSWAIGSLAAIAVHMGAADQFSVVVIANILLIIPGIGMVNAMRNLLCGNEMNGILQMSKVFFESCALILGLIISLQMFGGGYVVW